MGEKKRVDDRGGPRREVLRASVPYLGSVSAPRAPAALPRQSRTLLVATYNVHRWEPPGRKRRLPAPELASSVIEAIGADVVALQEVVRPFEGDDPLAHLSERLGYHVAFVTTRIHPKGELGNAVLSRWPVVEASLMDLRFSRIERRTAVMVRLGIPRWSLRVVSTHLALFDRIRRRQVRRLLDQLTRQDQVILLGDMNLWRSGDHSHLALEAELPNQGDFVWPGSFPAGRPVLPLDRVYARGAMVLDIGAHTSPAARRASDHLPVVARVRRL